MQLQLINTPKHPPLPITSAWLPPAMQAPGTRLKIRFSAADRHAMRRKKQIPVSEWAERYRFIPKDAALPGPWRNSTVPYMAGVMDASMFPSVQQIILCWPPQCGKSDGVNTVIGYLTDSRPGNVLYVFPDELTARENNRDRITPMFQDSDQLKKYFTGYADDTASLCLRLKHAKIYMAWANSASRMANKPLPYVVLDEEDKYPSTPNAKEASPADLAKKRTRTFSHMRKVFRMSTPTVETGAIWKALTEEAEVIFDFWVRCPACNSLQQMVFSQIKWPDTERDPRAIETEKLAKYHCISCPDIWDDSRRNMAVRAGEWRDREKGLSVAAVLNSRRPTSIGFHLRSYVSRFVSLSESAAAFLWGLKDRNKHKDFCNSHEAEPWREYSHEKTEDAILSLRDDRPMGRVPGGGVVSGLVAGIDTQDDGFFYEIRAFGFGLEQDSWQIRAGFVTSLEALKTVLWSDAYLDPDGKRYMVSRSLIDAMGHRTAEVYDFCRLNPGRIFPTKGERTMRQPHAWSRIDFYPGTNKPIPSGLQLVRVHTTHFKNQLASMLEVPFADPGSWKYCADTTIDWATQMTSEYIAETGFWETKGNRPNHAWDCSVLALCAADMAGFRFLQPSPKKRDSQHTRNEDTERGGWIERSGSSWINR